ncbi:MAG TPA: hypothetical protein VN788_01360, partial [Verrucomicrobiae bacterium]|nr:hypothetical protein [Verrucomicrobiae bacterium]
ETPHAPWTIFLYTNNYLRALTCPRQNIARILVLRPFGFMWSAAARRRCLPPGLTRACSSREQRSRF